MLGEKIVKMGFIKKHMCEASQILVLKHMHTYKYAYMYVCMTTCVSVSVCAYKYHLFIRTKKIYK